MNNYAQTAAQLRTLTNFLQGLGDAADKLDKLDSLDNAIDEAARARDAANVARAAAIAEVEVEKANLVAARVQVVAVLADGHATAMDIEQQAQDDAAALVAKGAQQVKDMLAQATVDAASQQKELLARNDYLKGQIASQENVVARLTDQIADLNAQADSATIKLLAAQDAIKKLLGGQA